MQGWKEKASKVIQRIRKNRLVQWLYDKDISTQYRILFVILASVIVIWNIVNIYFNSFKIDDVSARYLLSALVQSLAAIIAIVVTLTLVAVQLTASAYSPRVIDIFKKDRIMWLLLVWYGLSIFFGLFVLEMLGGEYQNLSRWGVPLELCVFLVYLMGIIAFAGLFWHIGNVINLLKPENIIDRLAVKITEDRILNSEEYPIQPIVDIVHGSVMKYDITTTRVGLRVVTERIIEIVGSDIHLDDKKEVSRCFCDHFKRIGRLAVIKTDEEATEEIIKNLYRFCETIVEKKLDDAAKQAVKSLGLVGRISAENGLEDAASEAAESLGDVGKAAAEKGLEGATDQAARSLGDVGKAAAEKGLERAVEQAWVSIGQVGKIAAKNGLRGAAASAAMNLVFFGRFEIEKGNDYNVEQVIWFLKEIGNAGAEKRLERVTWQVAKSLGLLGIDAAEKGKEFEEVTKKVIYFLNYIEVSAEVPGLEKTTKQVAQSFIDIGVFTVKNGLDGTAQEAAKFLAKLSISNKEPVEQAIHESESKLQEYFELFQKFINLYEQQLEELRTQNPD